MESISEILNKNKINVHFYHPDTYEHIDSVTVSELEYKAIKENFTNITTKKLKYDNDYNVLSGGYIKNTTNVFNKTIDDWELLEDYREFVYNSKSELIKNKIKYKNDSSTSYMDFRGYYLPLEGDEPGDPRRFNSTFGPLPDGAVLNSYLPSKEDIINVLRKNNIGKYTRIINTLLGSKDNNYIIIDQRRNKIHINGCVVDIKLNILTRAKLGDESALKVLPYLNCDLSVLDEIDKFSMCYYYYNSWLDTENVSYKQLYQEYADDDSPDYDKIKIELGI